MKAFLIFSLGITFSFVRLQAGSFEVTVKDVNGAPVADAVVYAEGDKTQTATRAKTNVIDQQKKEFIPYVTAVQVGTAIIFPNKDNIRHHVYSLSPAKKFELPLYRGTPAAPVLFDKVGFVTLGCNIHDWMVAYVAVLPTPYFAVTGSDGRATLDGLPSGQYRIEAWHPLLKGDPRELAQSAEVSGSKQVSFTLELKPDFRAQRAPGISNGGYP